jgi:hypothetical protein
MPRSETKNQRSSKPLLCHGSWKGRRGVGAWLSDEGDWLVPPLSLFGHSGILFAVEGL